MFQAEGMANAKALHKERSLTCLKKKQPERRSMSRELSEQEENSEEKRSPKWQKVTEVTVTKSLKQ